ncbi:PREDICTED: SH3 domain-containing kinase-binding protein 1-like isoform X3 [Branchiostoma belcheri]|uniref:SH3 domain-containing kinase-binding protein 1-like isoform X3 n=1 Tax=Branchiostoma belcheri TaxID=7741 RepID=A0A6P5B003_BRABE|nr:PREDICTED: SH3 domain-containing kinase-binding protein 1-like isoform X3 [Branchiostoma belcheri]
MVEVRVEFDYEAELDDELSLKIGDIITNVKQQDGGWWEGELNGKKGVFPDNFVKVIKKGSPPAKPSEKTNSHDKDEGGNVAKLASRLSMRGVPLAGMAPPGEGGVTRRPQAEKTRKLRCKAQYSYAPENMDELRLEVGDVIEILKQEEEGWWEGTLNGKSGVFPSNFVEVIKDEDKENIEEHQKEKTAPAPQQEEKNGPSGEQPQQQLKQPKKVRGVGLGDIFGNSPLHLRTKAADSIHDKDKHTHTDHIAKSGSLKKKAPPVPSEPPAKEEKASKPVEKAKVLFDYTAENEDELSLKVGEVIIIRSKESVDSGWWEGEVNGKTGVFPDNFVELLPPEEQGPEVPPRQVLRKITPPRPKKPPPPAASVKPVGGLNKLSHDKKHEDKHDEKADKQEHTDKPTNKPDDLPIRHLGRKPGTLPPKPSGSIEEKLDKKSATLPIIPPKKPGPPTTAKKPTLAKSTESLNSTSSVEQNADGDVGNFDHIQVSPDKLTHLTAQRAKHPNRRPPSMFSSPKPVSTWLKNSKGRRPIATDGYLNCLAENENEVEETRTETVVEKKQPEVIKEKLKEEKEEKEEVAPPPWAKDIRKGASLRRGVIPPTTKEEPLPEKRPPPPAVHRAKPTLPLQTPAKPDSKPTTPTEQPVTTPGTPLDTKALEDLRGEVRSLREQMTKMQSDNRRKMNELLNEIDEEKKVRMAMQVELDRLKKLVMS